MSVEYTELDNGTPCLCFCSDLTVPITNKTMIKSFINYIDNDLKFKISNLQIQTLTFTFVSNEITSVSAKVNGKFAFMGFVNTDDIYNCMTKAFETLDGWGNES